MEAPWCPLIVARAMEIAKNGGTQEDINNLFYPKNINEGDFE